MYILLHYTEKYLKIEVKRQTMRKVSIPLTIVVYFGMIGGLHKKVTANVIPLSLPEAAEETPKYQGTPKPYEEDHMRIYREMCDDIGMLSIEMSNLWNRYQNLRNEKISTMKETEMNLDCSGRAASRKNSNQKIEEMDLKYRNEYQEYLKEWETLVHKKRR